MYCSEFSRRVIINWKNNKNNYKNLENTLDKETCYRRVYLTKKCWQENVW